jgi:hypothetical protein
MLIARRRFCFFLLAWGAIFLSGITSTAAAQDRNDNPCETGSPLFAALPEARTLLSANGDDSVSIKTRGLNPVDFGIVVYDSNQGVCWLAA